MVYNFMYLLQSKCVKVISIATLFEGHHDKVEMTTSQNIIKMPKFKPSTVNTIPGNKTPGLEPVIHFNYLEDGDDTV